MRDKKLALTAKKLAFYRSYREGDKLRKLLKLAFEIDADEAVIVYINAIFKEKVEAFEFYKKEYLEG